MRRLWMLYLTLGLVATQGCHKTLQHTCGVCDCYPPPVGSLLVAPCPSGGNDTVTPVHGPYAPAPYAAMPTGGNTATPVNGTPILGGAPAKPSNDKPATDKPGNNKPAAASDSEPIRSLPKIVETPK
jgi:hypothetical protein